MKHYGDETAEAGWTQRQWLWRVCDFGPVYVTTFLLNTEPIYHCSWRETIKNKRDDTRDCSSEVEAMEYGLPAGAT